MENLFKYFDMWVTSAGSNIPVNISNIIAILILTHLTERHTSALEARFVRARKFHT